jgi:hypothetical protein
MVLCVFVLLAWSLSYGDAVASVATMDEGRRSVGFYDGSLVFTRIVGPTWVKSIMPSGPGEPPVTRAIELEGAYSVEAKARYGIVYGRLDIGPPRYSHAVTMYYRGVSCWVLVGLTGALPAYWGWMKLKEVRQKRQIGFPIRGEVFAVEGTEDGPPGQSTS